MKSTVRLTRETTADVTVEHPDEWGEDQVHEAATVRAIDVAGAAPFWSSGSTNRTTITEVILDEEPEANDNGCCYPSSGPTCIQLTAEDLVE